MCLDTQCGDILRIHGLADDREVEPLGRTDVAVKRLTLAIALSNAFLGTLGLAVLTPDSAA